MLSALSVRSSLPVLPSFLYAKTFCWPAASSLARAKQDLCVSLGCAAWLPAISWALCLSHRRPMPCSPLLSQASPSPCCRSTRRVAVSDANTRPNHRRCVQKALPKWPMTWVYTRHGSGATRGIVDAIEELIDSGELNKFDVGPQRIRRLTYYLYSIDPKLFGDEGHPEEDERIEEPNLELEAIYQQAFALKSKIARRIEEYSHVGIFMFIRNYHLNWVSEEYGRGELEVQQAMLDILFAQTGHDEIWQEYTAFTPLRYPEEIWQFSRQRYRWAKAQWPNPVDESPPSGLCRILDCCPRN